MSDKELLEFAAKAAGIDAEWHNEDEAEYQVAHEGMFLNGARSPDNSKYWNPLTDDGDALRLAVKLNLFDENSDFIYELAVQMGKNADPYAATRRAIVRAAAEISKATAPAGEGGKV